MWADQSKNGLNTYQNGSSGFQTDVKGRADVGYCQLHDTKNTKNPHKEGTNMATNSNIRVTQLCNFPWAPHHIWTNYIPGPFQNGMMWPGPTWTVGWQRPPPLKWRSCTVDTKANALAILLALHEVCPNTHRQGMRDDTYVLTAIA